MRALTIAGSAVALLTLVACGRPASDAQRIAKSPPSAQQTSDRGLGSFKSPGSTRLASGRERPALAAQSTAGRAPMATFTQYDGRAPGDAILDERTRSTSTRLTTPERTARPRSASAVGARDIVDMGLDSNTPRSAIRRPAQPEQPRATEVALARAPAPKPRPVVVSPSPNRRPTVSGIVQPAAPASAPQPALTRAPVALTAPTIAALRSPSLSLPATNLDATPSGLPTFPGQAPRGAGGIPLGTVPASLGAANIRAGEAAALAVDGLEQSNADESGNIEWSEVAALIKAGEIKSYADIGEFELLLTLCSGRGVIAVQPTPDALAKIEPPKVICGKTAAMVAE